MKHLVIHHNTSLGDHIVCNGIVHTYARKYDVIHLACQENYYESVQCLYQDFPNIIVHPFDTDINKLRYQVNEFVYKNGYALLRIGLEKVKFTDIGTHSPWMCPVYFDWQFYELAEVLFKYRYLRFKFPKKVEGSEEIYKKVVGDHKEYILVHNMSSLSNFYPIDLFSWRNNENNHLPIIQVKPGITNNIFQWIDVIKNATEIHAVPSSFFCLVDSVATQIKPKLCYHDIRLDTKIQVNTRWNNHRWHLRDYDPKV